ncbi:SusD family [Sphingobacterium spiritivorum]|uniref:SusD family n=1 Tax=Sphingobacterium spiritivorum TaxID=258 RepID=A0A380CJJ4_SPHSI|nr:RagB/SusD family nutrient uptake outer membrane protein [Sphingobacterium spiritivorum]SUJ21114.1 SusD family [Sphingobacterium spiritivorum]
MKNKYINNILGVLLLGGTLVGCKKDFLDRKPITQISTENFFNSPADLQLYVNKYYGTLGPISEGNANGYCRYDANTDMLLLGNSYDTRLAGQNTIPSTGGWSYGNIRDVNIFFANFSKAQGNQTDLDKFYGEASFFRAWFYFGNLINYGAIPIVDKPLPAEYEVVKDIPKSPRNQVVDFILKDLDAAIDKLPLKSVATRGRLNKEAALLFKSRVALYEGTWEKYHAADVFGVPGSDGQKYLQAARDAAKALMDLGTLKLYGNSISDYKKMFYSTDLSSVSEAILWKDYSVASGIINRVQNYSNIALNAGASKTFVESFLCLDGKPIKYNGTTNPLYQGDRNLDEVFKNRDPRLTASIAVPGYNLATNAVFQEPTLDKKDEFRDVTGYRIAKGFDNTLTIPITTPSITGALIFRYAEALLNYAEARAELGELTQADLDLTVNKLRARAKNSDNTRVADLSISGTGVTDADPQFSWGSSPIVNEIRRERMAELNLEGFRRNDLMRWAIADKIFSGGFRPLGMKYLGSSTQAYFVINNPAFDTNTVSGNGKAVYLDANGYLDPNKGALPAGFAFVKGRDYLVALSINDMNLGNYPQNPGW